MPLPQFSGGVATLQVPGRPLEQQHPGPVTLDEEEEVKRGPGTCCCLFTRGLEQAWKEGPQGEGAGG